MKKPLCIDLFCGLGGWSEGFLAEGYECVGFDIEKHDYGTGRYPGHLVLQDILTVHGSQFKDATCIVASPPCQNYSYMAMPWTRAKYLRAWYSAWSDRAGLNDLFDACFRIQDEACKAAGRHIPMIVENVRGARRWVGQSAGKYGSYYLWGDLPFQMPNLKHEKVPGFNFHQHLKTGKGGSFQTASVKVASENGRRTDVGNGTRFTSRDCGSEGLKLNGGRKSAAAQIAKIPLTLSQHVARMYKEGQY